MRGFNPLIPKQNQPRISREQKAEMLANLYGVHQETMSATNILGGFSPEQIEAIRLALGVPPKANMGVQKEFDINKPDPAIPPPGGWPTLPAVVHRLHKNKPESKIVRSAHERDEALASGWSTKPLVPIEVDTDPPIPASDRAYVAKVDKIAKKKKGDDHEYVPEDETAA